MRLFLPLTLAACALAGPAFAGEHFYAYDPASDSARLLTRGVTLQVERGWFGFGTRVERLYSTAGEGSADLDPGGLSGAELRAALPAEADESGVYRIDAEGHGAALARVLCPGAAEVYLVFGRVRPLRDLTVHAVGRGAAGTLLCTTLEYRYRGEWTQPDPRDVRGEAPLAPPRY